MKNQHSDEPRPVAVEKPWVTGFLIHLLIRYIQEKIPGGREALNYGEILRVVKGFEHIREPESFLTDRNHWLPQEVLQLLLKRCEEISGDAEVAYKAALYHFPPREGRNPSALEMIASILADMKLVFLCAPLWAGVYTNNYLKLQPFEIPGAPCSIGLLAQFQPQVTPLWSNHLLVRGNCEGFGRLYDFIDAVWCEEEFLQIQLEDLVVDFEGYELRTKGRNKIVYDLRLKRPVLEALPVYLMYEPVPSLPEVESFPKDLLILPIQKGFIRILTTRSQDNRQEREMAYQIAEGGTLSREGLVLTLKRGQILNAPYSRYRFNWRELPSKRERVKEVPLKQFSTFLFSHLRDLRDYQQRLLGMIIENVHLSSENRDLKREVAGDARYMGIVGKGRPMQELYSLIEAIAPTDATVLITGETGTGKELVARALHNQGPRCQGRFLALNCGALSEHLLESELFGHERGSFTGAIAQKKGKFELAHKGTLFLDEIGEIPPAVQVRLLRVLQERSFHRVGGNDEIHVDVRIIAATNEDLESLVKEGRFRKDLFYRLNVIPLRLPPLRERQEDIPLLVEHFIQKTRTRHPHPIQEITPEALEYLMAYGWPGNVRELENVIERAVALAGDRTLLMPELLPRELTKSGPQGATALGDLFDQLQWQQISQFMGEEGTIDSLINHFEWRIVQQAIQGHGGNKSRAARALKRSYRWLRKLEKRLEEEGHPPP